ncbi:ABC transporter permease [Paenibacillus woosongensis]|uniref:ABC transporter permease n=1 Tax=Paenibacillus woosongensis TaxID=307580 RepID=A0AA95IAZ9_9BACL|nr:ABC transporter permease [Paenibacillus woosongensis]WHX49817.1 ABC transporter permease [Paenibacillus woosongensis]
MNKLLPIINFTFANKVKTKSFVVTTVIFALLLSIGIHVPYLIQLFSGNEGGTSSQIGLVYGNQPEIAASLEAFIDKQPDGKIKLVKYEQANDQALMHDMENGTIKGYLEFGEAEGLQFPKVMYTSKKNSMDLTLQSTLQPALENVKMQYVTRGSSLTEEQIAAISAPVIIEELKAEQAAGTGSAADANEGSKPAAINYVIVYGLIVLFFMTNMMTGNMIAAEVTSEKSSRIMEILVTSVSPLTQMFGKILGMFLVGLLQIAIFIAVVAINLALPYNQASLAELNLDLSQMDLSILLVGLIFYILGYFLYATLYAAVGSIVSRTEDLGQAVMPITMLSLAAFYVAMFSLSSPNSLLLKVCSYIPFVSPVTILLRYGAGDATLLEVGLSLLILIVAIVFFSWLAAKIYRTGVLLYGKRPTMKELRKAMKAYKI